VNAICSDRPAHGLTRDDPHGPIRMLTGGHFEPMGPKRCIAAFVGRDTGS
jgi:hypothetical protein